MRNAGLSHSRLGVSCQPELGPDASGTSGLKAPDFAGEQMELGGLEAFVSAALLAGGKLGSRPGFVFILPSLLPSTPLSCIQFLSDP